FYFGKRRTPLSTKSLSTTYNVGLTRGFMYAGVLWVIVSLWREGEGHEEISFISSCSSCPSWFNNNFNFDRQARAVLSGSDCPPLPRLLASSIAPVPLALLHAS